MSLQPFFRLVAFLALLVPAARAREAYLLTFGPGPEIYERFGHNALVLLDDERGLSTAYNWGVFDFDAPGFTANFARGRMWYELRGYDADETVQLYAAALDRTVVNQNLDLAPEQWDRLYAHVSAADTDARRGYRYDYYRDNCSTRIRDALDVALGGNLKVTFDAARDRPSYRVWNRRLVAPKWLYVLGMDLAGGTPIDRPLTRWEEAFLPQKLSELVGDAVNPATGASLAQRPHVVKADGVARFNERDSALWGFPLVGAVLALGMLATTRLPRTLNVLIGTWAACASLAAIVLPLMWFATDHWPAVRNFNVLQASYVSLALLACALVPRWRAGRVWFAGAAFALSAGDALLRLAGVIPQPGLPTLGLTVPLHAATFAALLLAARRRPHDHAHDRPAADVRAATADPAV